MAGERPELSVIVVNWNGGTGLSACLDSVGRATDGLRAEVFVVDNGSTDGSAEMVEARAQVTLLRNPGNVGFARAANRAIGAARGELLLLLNPDAEIDREALGGLLAVMGGDGRVGIAGCSSVDGAGRVAPGYELSYPGERGVSVGPGEGGGRDVAWVSGACLAARREMVDDIGLLDEGFFMYYEDVDWCRRARQAGWRVVTAPEVRIRHELGGSAGLVPAAETARRAAESRLRFYRKHYPRGRAKWLAARIAGSAAAGLALSSMAILFSRGARERVGVEWAVLRTALAGRGRRA